jgi:hypothetical protein
MKRPQGLKPFFTLELYAALKRRSSTVAPGAPVRVPVRAAVPDCVGPSARGNRGPRDDMSS